MAAIHTGTGRDVAGPPLYGLLLSFPMVCFTLTLLTDIAYWQTSYLMWQNFSAWLLLTGIVFGAVAAIVGLVGILVSSHRGGGALWLRWIGGLLILALAVLNSLVHAGDGWTAVVPWGLALSAATVLVMLLIGWLVAGLADRHGAEVPS